MASVASWAVIPLLLYQGVPLRMLWIYLPVFIVSMIVVVQLINDHWRDRMRLEKLCAANFLVNLGTTSSLIFAFLG
jgi:cytochrome b subunit of formate dehydrogenase